MVPIGLGKGLGLNDLGQAVGNFHHHNDFAFVWDFSSGMVFLNRGDFLFATANAVNNSGMAVGYARKFDDIDGTKAILWDSGPAPLRYLKNLRAPHMPLASIIRGRWWVTPDYPAALFLGCRRGKN